MELLAGLCHVILIAAGFKLQHLGGIDYYTLHMGPQQLVQAITKPLAAQQQQLRNSQQGMKPAAAAAGRFDKQQQQQDQQQQDGDEAMPVVFLHGVGAGLLPYLSLVFHLATLGRPMILPESKHVSMRLVRWLPTVDDMADGTAAIMAAHGVDKAAVMAHSYGTMVAARLVLKYEGLVHSLCLLDPVSVVCIVMLCCMCVCLEHLVCRQ
jgi:pimeloyl-ACP methyl ester carboxylesterase